VFGWTLSAGEKTILAESELGSFLRVGVFLFSSSDIYFRPLSALTQIPSSSSLSAKKNKKGEKCMRIREGAVRERNSQFLIGILD
jgi:hypothetical protein